MAATTAFAQDCRESKWGADDEIGSANLVTPENTLMAAKLIKQGKSTPLGIVIDSKTPAFAPRSLNLQVVQPNQQGGQKLTAFGYPGNYNDDILQTWVGIGSQIDGLGHLGEKGYYYNCLDEKEISAITGLTKSLSLDGRPFGIACGQIDIGNTRTPMVEDLSQRHADANPGGEPMHTFAVEDAAASVLHMANLPLEANVQFMTVMATKMPYIGRG